MLSKKRLNFLLRRYGKLILPDKNLTIDQKLNKIGILNLHKQLDYNKGVFMYRALTNSAPVYISSLYKAPHSSSRNNYLQLPKPRIDLFKTSMAFSGALFWNSLPVHLRSCHSISSFKRNLREHLNTTYKTAYNPPPTQSPTQPPSFYSVDQCLLYRCRYHRLSHH